MILLMIKSVSIKNVLMKQELNNLPVQMVFYTEYGGCWKVENNKVSERGKKNLIDCRSDCCWVYGILGQSVLKLI